MIGELDRHGAAVRRHLRRRLAGPRPVDRLRTGRDRHSCAGGPGIVRTAGHRRARTSAWRSVWTCASSSIRTARWGIGSPPAAAAANRGDLWATLEHWTGRVPSIRASTDVSKDGTLRGPNVRTCTGRSPRHHSSGHRLRRDLHDRRPRCPRRTCRRGRQPGRRHRRQRLRRPVHPARGAGGGAARASSNGSAALRRPLPISRCAR